jgi:hypothetical protein
MWDNHTASAQNGVHRQPETLLGPFGRLVYVAARYVTDDKDVDVVWRVACDESVRSRTDGSLRAAPW